MTASRSKNDIVISFYGRTVRHRMLEGVINVIYIVIRVEV